MNQNFFEPNPCYEPNYSSFDQYHSSQSSVTSQLPQRSNEDVWLEMEKLIKNNRILLNNNDFPHEETSMEVLLAKERIFKLIQAWDEKQIESWSFLELLPNFLNDSRTIEQSANLAVQQKQGEQADNEEVVLSIAWERISNIKYVFIKPEEIPELMCKLLEDVTNIRVELAVYINSPSWNRPTFFDNDEEDSILYKKYLKKSSDAITPILPIEEPEYSLSMGYEHLSTILEIKSDEVIQSSAKNLLPIPSEYEVTSDDESECEVLIKDDSSPVFTTFSNPIFDCNDDFMSRDDESLPEEDVSIEEFKVYSNPLFDDEEIISTKIDPHYFNAESNLIESLLNRDTLIDSYPKFDFLLKEFFGELAYIDPILPGIEEADFELEEEIHLVENLLYDNSSQRPPKELNVEIADTIVESLSPSPIPEIPELMCKLLEDVTNIRVELAVYINSPSWNRPTFFDNDEEDSILYKKYLKKSSDAITPILPIEEPEYSLSMGYEHLSTILEIKSDEVIQSSAKNLLPIPSEYEVTSDDESECEVLIKDDSSPVFTTFSNPIFDCNDDFMSRDDESLPEEDVSIEEFKVYSNPLFDDEEINSDEIDPHCFNAESDFVESLSNCDTLIESSPKFDFLEEFSSALMPTSIAGEECIRREHAEYISLMKRLFIINPCPRLLENFHANTIIETLPTSPIPLKDSDSQREEIDIFTGTDDLLPPSIENDNYDSEGDINVLEELLVDDSISLPENESSDFDHQDDPLFPRPPPEPSDVEFLFDLEPNSGEVITVVINNIVKLNEDECFDPGGDMKDYKPSSNDMLENKKKKEMDKHGVPPMKLFVFGH
uniref:Reverse transcriptase domain-containing protein n=1 Tax=Tanacetum cinerariifolium TaxID=118510 RepID=A0A6L2JY03_TANCI|nr:hypothetical protein [Tanacetum cinerariifolium]